VPENTPQFLVTQFIAVAIQAKADAALTRGLLGSPDLPADVLAAIRRDLDALGPPPEPAAGLAMERLFGIDTVVWLARRTPGGRAARQAELDRFAEALEEWIPRSGWAAAGHAVPGCCSRRYRSDFVGDAVSALFLPAINSYLDAVTRSQASFDLRRTAAALAA